jgi:hypothetical protein
VDEPVDDGVTDGWIADDFVPVLRWIPAGDESGPDPVAFVDQLEEVAILTAFGHLHPPLINDQQVGPAEPSDQFCQAPVGVGGRTSRIRAG